VKPRLVVPLLLAPLLLTGWGAGTTPTAARLRDVARTSPVVMGYALEGSATPAMITRDGDFLDTVGVDGVSLTARGGVTALSAQAAGLRRAANRAGRPPVLLFSNYNNAIGDFDEARAHRMLASPRKRAVVARALARRAVGFRGVQIDLESLKPRDGDGLVAFTRAVRRALPQGRTVSMAFMASRDARGYAARGYQLTALARLLDVAALMTYDQHGPWSAPGPIAALPWVKAELRYFLTRVPRRKVDLGAAAYGYQWGGGASELTVPQARHLAGSRATWNATYGEWHATLANGRRLWWDDDRSVDLRRRLAVDQHLHGLAIWQIGSSGPLRP
jgi:spore germination protein